MFVCAKRSSVDVVVDDDRSVGGILKLGAKLKRALADSQMDGVRDDSGSKVDRTRNPDAEGFDSIVTLRD
jgi:hypothetical protein